MITAAITRPTTWIILALLGIVCTLYAFKVVRRLRTETADHGQTAWLVVIGVAIVIVAVTAIIAAYAGLAVAIDTTALWLLAFSVAGLPMVIEYVGGYLGRQKRARQLGSDITTILIGARDDKNG